MENISTTNKLNLLYNKFISILDDKISKDKTIRKLSYKKRNKTIR